MRETSVKSMREIAGPATMRVLSLGEDSRRFIGTAFAVNDHVVLTCRHVVEGAKNAGSVVVDGTHLGDIRRFDWSVHEDPYMDVAIGVTDQGTFGYWLTPVCEDIAGLVEPVVCVGYGADNQGVVSWRDHVAGQVRTHGLVTLQNGVRAGSSGGPVLNGDGCPVAIIVARNLDRTGKYILPVRLFYAWMQAKGFRPAVHGQDDSTERHWVS